MGENSIFNFYNLTSAIEYCSQMLGAISDTLGIHEYGLNSDTDFGTYQKKLYELYDIATSNNAVDSILNEMESDDIDSSWFREIIEEDTYFKLQSEHKKLAETVEVGDYVKLYNGNRFYVCNRDGRNLWVTKEKSDRTNPNAAGWYSDLYDIVEIVERYN